MKIELRPLAAVKPYEKNPRNNDGAVDAVAESIRRFGFRQPIVVDTDGAIVCGHTRWKAAHKLGLDKVPVHVAKDLTPEQIRSYRIADNKTNELASWDMELLPIELAELQGADLDWTLLGFDQDMLAMLLVPGIKQGFTDPDDIPEPPDAATTQPGDLWILGDHRLLCGDSASAVDVDRLLDGQPIHLVNTDPPYNVKVEPRSNNAIAAGLSSFPAANPCSNGDSRSAKKKLTHHQGFDLSRGHSKAKRTTTKLRAKDRPLANDFVSDEAFEKLLQAWFGNIARVLEPGRGFYIWGGYANCANYPPVLKASELYFSQAIIWVKEHPVLTRKDFMGNHEWCFYGWRQGAAHLFLGPNNVPDVWSIKKVNPQSMIHLTEKPVELAVRAMQYSSRAGENVLDLFGGSGSTLIAYVHVHEVHEFSMGMIYKKAWTTPPPRGAEIVRGDARQVARWRLRNGKLQSAEVVESADGKVRIRGQSQFYTVRYRDGQGQIVDVPTKCKDEVAARAILTGLERRAELVRAGVLTAAEDQAVDHAGVPISKHFDAYERHLRAKGGNARRISMVRRRLERVIRECKFTRLRGLSAAPIERWLADQADAGVAAATRNGYRESLVGFGNWCRRTGRVTQNPFLDLPRADPNSDRRHQRRALTVAELKRLLKVAQLRPLAEYGREIIKKAAEPKRSPASRATWNRQPLDFETIVVAAQRGREALIHNSEMIEQLEGLGWERMLLYKTLVLTGLRKSELASLTIGQLNLDGPVAHAELDAADEKNRRGSNIPVRADLATELAEWLADRLSNLQAASRRASRPMPTRLPANAALFNVPEGLSRILDRDLKVAGIPKRDERNRVVDVHALRVTFGTHLCAAGVPLRTAQAAMRHSKPELTANIYTDPKLLDVAGAIAALPILTAAYHDPSETHDATGTAG